jgi:MFS transporter, PAT family, beta-lactamase induction signal transducer AmpG
MQSILSALASIGRVWVGPLAGVLAESVGWPIFVLSAIATAPALVLLWWLRQPIKALEFDPKAPLPDTRRLR